ncbi:MAG: hypothetical protein ACREDF_06780, partial [Thermoplasmata archaeon]
MTRGERVEFLTNLEVEVRSSAGPPKNGTPVLWGTNQGSVSFETTLSGGRGKAIYSTPVRKDLVFFPATGIFAVVGRGKGAIADFPSTFDGSAPPTVTLDNYRLNGDNPSGASADFPGQTAVHYRGGVPGASITLELGTAGFPVVQPFAAYPLDLLEAGSTTDAFGNAELTASVNPTVSLETTDSVFGDGSYRFIGAGGLNVPH